MDGLWKYRFGCRNCGKVLYLETISDEQTNYNCSNCNSLNVVQKDQRWKDGKWYEMEINEINKFDEIVETPTTKPEALKKLKEAKEHLELELITQDDYDKLKNELSPIIMSSSDEESETETDTDEKSETDISKVNWDNYQSEQNSNTDHPINPPIKPEEKKKRSLGMKLLLSFGLTILMNIAIQVVNPHWGEESKYTRQRIVTKQFGSGFDAEKYFPKKEKPLEAIASGVFAIIWVVGIYRIFKNK